ncbi:flagellar hook-length control protein FliK [Halomonas chromatireducens]|uniref:Flagellar hook-length control protein n=1 Tax=Halomonas chromatireducens TaxID=507626 RepID=A0A120JWY0_9GAMM|nr:flagellar hook-length control protein FliK [Halomonas chromatireducens]AMD02711.1 Flagellar hook-length control protein [Halomonas chromatireducens]
MDIQMMLSALPGKPMSKAQPGAEAAGGHFALALAGAGRSQPDAKAALPAQLSAQQQEGARPSMAAQQVLLQALSVHDPDLVADMEAVPLPDTLSLSDIMERLTLIEGNQPAGTRPLVDATDPQTINMQAIAEQAAVAEPDSSADHAVAALAAADALRQAAPPARPLGDAPATAKVSLNGAQALSTPQQASRDVAESTPRPGFLAQIDSSTAERPMRTAEFVRTAETAAVPQLTAGDLRGMSTDTLRPAVIEPTAPSLQTAQQPAGTATQAMPTPATPAQASLPAPVQGQAWTGQLGQQLVQFARLGGEQQIEMKLNPAELGPLSITLKMTEQGAQAQFLSAHAQVRQVLEQAIPQLREALAEQGISLGETSVGEQRQQEGQAFASQENQRGSGADETDAHLPSATDIGLAENVTGVSLDGRVNLYA